ncbi:MAG: hypothetical protein IKP95_03660 [Ruminococcus sp.]|nr:hypothetical protein [Ruminococcus sp.]
MSNFKQPDPRALAALLKLASAKLGTTPERLEAQLKDGTFGKALGNMPGREAASLKAALSDPKSAEKILSTPQAKALYEKLSKK